MIFVTVGSQKFPFERLIKEVDRLAGLGIFKDEVFAQIGVSQYEPKNINWKRFLDKKDFDEHIESCNLLITHAGEGAIMTGLLRGKKVIAVPRYAKLGEHVSDHQFEISRELSKGKFIINVEDISQLAEAICKIKECEFKKYVSSKETIIDKICEFIG